MIMIMAIDSISSTRRLDDLVYGGLYAAHCPECVLLRACLTRLQGDHFDSFLVGQYHGSQNRKPVGFFFWKKVARALPFIKRRELQPKGTQAKPGHAQGHNKARLALVTSGGQIPHRNPLVTPITRKPSSREQKPQNTERRNTATSKRTRQQNDKRR
jgi:hypothetical protein